MAHTSGLTARAAGSENTEPKQRPRLFQPGQSGNPSGRPPGSRNKTTLAVDALLDGEAETLTRKAIELAKAGDLVALRLCLDRICPPRKGRHPRSARARLPRSRGDGCARGGRATPRRHARIARVLPA